MTAQRVLVCTSDGQSAIFRMDPEHTRAALARAPAGLPPIEFVFRDIDAPDFAEVLQVGLDRAVHLLAVGEILGGEHPAVMEIGEGHPGAELELDFVGKQFGFEDGVILGGEHGLGVFEILQAVGGFLQGGLLR